MRSCTQLVDMVFFAKASTSFSLTLHNRSLKLNVLAADLLLSLEYNGRIRTNGVMPYNLFGGFLSLKNPKLVSILSIKR
jgi:hypothetical protein